MAEKSDEKVKMSKEERIGYHQGALECLIKERQELVRLVQIVEQLIQMHIAGLKEMGIDLTKAEQQDQPKKESKKPIEDLLRK